MTASGLEFASFGHVAELETLKTLQNSHVISYRTDSVSQKHTTAFQQGSANRGRDFKYTALGAFVLLRRKDIDDLYVIAVFATQVLSSELCPDFVGRHVS